MTPAALTLTLTQIETADHEAGHAVVAHLLGQGPRAVLIEDNLNGDHTGQTQSEYIPSENEVADLRMRLAVAVAGFLSHVKSVAGRHLDETVVFCGEQPWETLYVYLVSQDATPPVLTLRGADSSRTVSVSAAAPTELCNDRRDIIHFTCSLQGHGFNVCDEGARSLVETAATLDRPEVWGVVEAVSRALRDSTPTHLRRLEGDALKGLLKGLPTPARGGWTWLR
ncbi:hypothetical protein [Gemmata sp.]|uniref:hypothetical protein n=1 Tax=Gemmata sp. TaxID=1914242 RepID=UPI003F6FC3AA